jgi:PAS domain S-box-containing protein
MDGTTQIPCAPPERSPVDETVDELFYRRVVEGMRCGIITVDVHGRVITVNEHARDILEMEESIEPGGPVREVLGHHPRLAEVLVEALEMSYLPNRAEMEIRTRSEDGRTIGFTISPIVEDDAPRGVALFFKDLTQVERREEQDRLRDRLAALGQMAASMAHEIRNPLASIDVTATLLKRRLKGHDEEIERAIVRILDEVARLNRTITQGLEFTRTVSLARVPARLAEVVEDALGEASNRFAGHTIAIDRHFDEDLPEAEIDVTRMRQVFVNLIVNAFESFDGASGRIALTVRRAPGHADPHGAVDVMIEDDGPGIPDEVREKLFYPFVTTKREGSGIGLAMARKIVEAHAGHIDVRTKRGEGTEFRIRLPEAQASDLEE